MPEVSVVVPTYCEATNVSTLIPQIFQALQGRFSAEVIVVDDNSPDDTADVCRKLGERYQVRVVVRRHERGLSSAVLHGLHIAKGEKLVVLDADLSHPPERIPDLLDALADRATDFVIGSRYVSGGSTDETWGPLRKLNSLVATALARPFTAVKDPMAGFFALRRETIEKAVTLDPIGYKIGLELLVKCRCRNVREVPIHFRNRKYGSSKLTLKEQCQYLQHLARLWRFKLVSGSTVPGRWKFSTNVIRS